MPENFEQRPRSLSTHVLALAAIFTLQAIVFYIQAATNFAPYYPQWHDQTGYLFHTYGIVTDLRSNWPSAVWAALNKTDAHGGLFALQGALLLTLIGPPRVGALSINLLGLLLLQTVMFWSVLKRTSRLGDAWVSAALVMLLVSPFMWAGGLFDYRIDFLALCQFGIWAILVLHSDLFSNLRWSVVAGLIAAWMAATRYVTFAYFAPAMGLTFIVFLICWVRSDDANRTAARDRVRNCFISGAIPTLIMAPILWINRLALYNYYFVGMYVSEEKEYREKQAGLSTLAEHLLYYPRRLLFSHLGEPWLWASAALVVWFAVSAWLLQKRASRDIWAQLYSKVPALLFLMLVCLVPLLILNSSIHKSPVVIGILCIPVTLMVIEIIGAFRASMCRTPNSAPAKTQFRGWLGWLNIHRLPIVTAIIFAALTFAYRAAAPKIGLPRFEQSRINQMYDEIIVYIIEKYGDLKPTISIDNNPDFIPNALTLSVRAYEQFGRRLRLNGGFGHVEGTGFFASPRDKAMRLFRASDIIVLTDKIAGRQQPTPLNAAIKDYWDEIRDWTEQNRIRLVSTTIAGVPYQVFVRPGMVLAGNDGEWLTSKGMTVTIEPNNLKRWPFLILEGRALYQFLGGDPAPLAVSGSTTLPATFTRTGPDSYRVAIDASALAVSNQQKATIELTFDRYFIPKELGINNVTAKLVVLFPTGWYQSERP